MKKSAVYIYNPAALGYRFSDTHPFNHERLRYTNDLLLAACALTESDFVHPVPISDELLHAVHTAEFINTVKQLSDVSPDESLINLAERYGLSDGDTPYFTGMHEATKAIVSGTVTAADIVLSGQARRALHLGGGLHHAFANKAAGFCVYNDASVAIAHIRRHYGARVLYIDTDVHHGDGVQAAFYSDPDVCTFSIHETGKYLFPGTGFAGERGEGDGFGYCFNLPVEPFTEDESWLANFNEAAQRITAFFKPDVIISQHGCDAHYFDPLSHQHCSMDIYLEMPRTIRRLADTWCDGRWIALGGGGYDIWRVVPRAWSLIWLVMTDNPLLAQLDKTNVPLPEKWLKAYANQAAVMLPPNWLDDKKVWDPVPRRQEIIEKNIQSKELALLYLPNMT